MEIHEILRRTIGSMSDNQNWRFTNKSYRRYMYVTGENHYENGRRTTVRPIKNESSAETTF